MITIFDEFTSRETSKHVTRSLRENARQGFWCGGQPPFGYKLEDAERRGSTMKKRLAVHPIEAVIVRKMFELYLQGDGASGPLGVKALTCWLNENGYRTRSGAPWGVGPIHRILADTTYKGDFCYNKNGAESDRVHVCVPEIVTASTFDAVQKALRDRNPRQQPPRTVTGPVLLSGLARCSDCGSSMVKTTGKSGRYTYYSCGRKLRQGKSACRGRSVRMDTLDNLVSDELCDLVITRSRVKELLTGLLQRRALRQDQIADDINNLKEKLAEAEGGLRRLYDAIEKGLADLEDPTFKEKLDSARTQRDIAQSYLETAQNHRMTETAITENLIDFFCGILRQKMLEGPIEFRREYCRAVLEKVSVCDNLVRMTDCDGRIFEHGLS